VVKTHVADKGAQGPRRSRADKEWRGDEDDPERESARRRDKRFEIERKGERATGRQRERLRVAQERREERETVEFA